MKNLNNKTSEMFKPIKNKEAPQFPERLSFFSGVGGTKVELTWF